MAESCAPLFGARSVFLMFFFMSCMAPLTATMASRSSSVRAFRARNSSDGDALCSRTDPVPHPPPPAQGSAPAGTGLGTAAARAGCAGGMVRANMCLMSRIYRLHTTGVTSLSHATVHEHEGGNHKFFVRANGNVTPRRTRKPPLHRMYRLSPPKFCVRIAVEVFPTSDRQTPGHSSGFRHKARTEDHQRTAYIVGLRHRARTEGFRLGTQTTLRPPGAALVLTCLVSRSPPWSAPLTFRGGPFLCFRMTLEVRVGLPHAERPQ